MTLSWSAPGSGDPVTTYVIEAGSSPGLANLANFSTGNTATTFSASGVPPGTYYVRVRASNGAGTSAASNEFVLVVTGGGCSGAPGPPTGLVSSVSGSTVTLIWSAPSGGCPATSFILQAGSFAGASDLANANVGNVTSYVATGVGAGTYYVRVRAQNATGQSGASNEVTVVVGSTAPGGVISFFGRGGCTYLTDAYGWTGCKADVNVNVTKIVRSGYVSAYILWSCADYFATCDWYFHGDVQVAAGTAPGLLTISTTSTYLPRINCSNSIPVVVEIYDGPQTISSAWPRGAPLLYSLNTRWVGFGCP